MVALKLSFFAVIFFSSVLFSPLQRAAERDSPELGGSFLQTELQMISHHSPCPGVAAASLPLAAWLLFPRLFVAPGEELILPFLLLLLLSFPFPPPGRSGHRLGIACRVAAGHALALLLSPWADVAHVMS